MKEKKDAPAPANITDYVVVLKFDGRMGGQGAEAMSIIINGEEVERMAVMSGLSVRILIGRKVQPSAAAEAATEPKRRTKRYAV